MNQSPEQLPKPVIPVSLPVLAEYVAQWRSEPDWPNVQADVLLVLYDILAILGVDEADMIAILGDDGAQYVCAVVDGTAYPTGLAHLPPWTLAPRNGRK